MKLAYTCIIRKTGFEHLMHFPKLQSLKPMSYSWQSDTRSITAHRAHSSHSARAVPQLQVDLGFPAEFPNENQPSRFPHLPPQFE